MASFFLSPVSVSFRLLVGGSLLSECEAWESESESTIWKAWSSSSPSSPEPSSGDWWSPPCLSEVPRKRFDRLLAAGFSRMSGMSSRLMGSCWSSGDSSRSPGTGTWPSPPKLMGVSRDVPSPVNLDEFDVSLVWVLSRKSFCLKSREWRVSVPVRKMETSKSSVIC